MNTQSFKILVHLQIAAKIAIYKRSKLIRKFGEKIQMELVGHKHSVTI